MIDKSKLPVKAWLCHESYTPGFMMEPPTPARDFVTTDPDVARHYNGKELVLLEDVLNHDHTTY